jgi:type I restriction enzyme S subunit
MEGIQCRPDGSTFMEISKMPFRPIPDLVPRLDIVKTLTPMASALFARWVENERPAQTFATLRDTRLPRPVSGQLRLPDAHAPIESAAV